MQILQTKSRATHIGYNVDIHPPLRSIQIRKVDDLLKMWVCEVRMHR